MEARKPHPGGITRHLRRSLALVVVLVMCGGAAGSWWGLHRKQEHEARAAILVAPLIGNPFSPEAGGDALVNLTTEAELVTSDAVAQLVSDRMPGHPAVADLLSGVSVKVPANTQVVEITVRNPVRAEAVRRAQAFATTFLAYREGRMQSAVFDRSARVKELIAERTKALEGIEATLQKLTGTSAREIALRQQVVDLTSQISELRTQLAVLEAASSDAGQVVTRAAAHASLLDNTTLLGAFAGCMAGLLLGLALAAARNRVDDRVLAPDDLAVIDVDVFGSVDDDSDGYRRLRTALLGTLQRRPMVVLLGDLPDAPQPAHSADGLAASLGSSGLEVVVVDALAEPRIGRGVRRSGLSDLIADPSGLDEALVATGPHVARLGVGCAPTSLPDLVDSPETDVLFQELRKRADVIIVVVGSTGSTTTGSLVRLADAVLIEVVEGQSGLAEVRRAVDVLARRDTVVGAVYVRPVSAAALAAATTGIAD